MKGVFLLLLVAAALVSCQSSKSEDTSRSNETPDHNVDSVQHEFARINTTVFEDLVSDNYGPHAVRSGEGHMVLDWSGYVSYLKIVNVFGQPFVDQERERCMPCENALDSLKYSGEQEAGWEPKTCPFALMYWLNSQEKPSGYEIKDLQINGDRATSTMVFYSDTDDGRHYWDDKISLSLEYGIENGGWRIFKINRLLHQ